MQPHSQSDTLMDDVQLASAYRLYGPTDCSCHHDISTPALHHICWPSPFQEGRPSGQASSLTIRNLRLANRYQRSDINIQVRNKS